MYIDDSAGLPDPAASTMGSSLHVTPDTVLAVRDAIQHAVEDAERNLRVEVAKFRVSPCAQDPVSLDAALAWNHRLVDGAESHANRITDYLYELRALVHKLTAAAQTYGLTEQANTDSLRGRDA